MPKVQFTGTDDGSRVDEVLVDDITLKLDDKPQEVTKDQLARLQALDGHKFKVTSEKKAAAKDSSGGSSE